MSKRKPAPEPTIEDLIDDVIACARQVQAEDGPDPDYRRFAKQELEQAKQALLARINPL